jgi:hypothetical protein
MTRPARLLLVVLVLPLSTLSLLLMSLLWLPLALLFSVCCWPPHGSDLRPLYYLLPVLGAGRSIRLCVLPYICLGCCW